MVRDGGCVAPQLDPAAGLCYDQWGVELQAWQPAHLRGLALEADYVQLGHRGKRHQYAADHVAVCAGHHRGAGPHAGHQWATAHRAMLRAYLIFVSEPVGVPEVCQHCSEPVAYHHKNGWVSRDSWEPHAHLQANA